MTTTPTGPPTGVPENPDNEPERYLRLVPGGLTEPAEPPEPGGPGTDLDTTGDAETVHVGAVIEGVPVDPDPHDDPPLSTTWATLTTRKRPPVIPFWLRDRAEFRARVRVAADLAGYVTAWYVTRSPKFAVKTLWYAPIGLVKTVGRVLHWASAEEGNFNLRQHAASSNDAYTWQALNRTRAKESKGRWWLVIPATLVLTIAVWVLAASDTVPRWGWWTALAVLTVLLARAGRPVDAPIIDRVSQGPKFLRLTGEMVRSALTSLGVGAMKDPAALAFEHPGIHRDGPGWLARVNLPEGIEAQEVLERRGKLSSALRLPVDQVWPSVGPGHAGQLDLWVGYRPSSKMGAAKWALTAGNATTSVFGPIPFGHDERMREVTCVFFQRNFLLGGQPGAGKTSGGRSLVLAALLDPTVEMWLAAFKPAEDFYDISPYCTRYVCGIDDATMSEAERMVADGLREVHRRQTLLGKLKREGKIAEGRTSAELAKMGLGLHPLILVFDEVHELFLSSKKAVEDMIRLVKQGRSAGVIVILITQVASKDSVPPEITRCVSSRWCMSVADQVANDQIMGTGAYKRGLSGAAYRPEVDAGWGVTDGMAGTYRGPARAYYPDDKQLAAMLARIAALRGTGGNTTTSDDAPLRDIVADALAVLADGEAGAWWEVLAARLADLDPTYRGITAEVVSARIRAAGIESVDVKMRGHRTGRKGARRADLITALNTTGQ